MESYKILVVDDNPENAERIIDSLQEMGQTYSFIQALNGKIANNLAEKKNARFNYYRLGNAHYERN